MMRDYDCNTDSAKSLRGFSASVCCTVRPITRIGSEDAQRLLERSNLLLAPGHSVCVAHTSVDAMGLQLDELAHSTLDEHFLRVQILSCCVKVSLRSILPSRSLGLVHVLL